MAGSGILSRIERSIFKQINDVFRTNGYAIDPSLPAYQGGTQAAEDALNSAYQSIIATNNFAVEVQGVKSSRATTYKRYPQIIIKPARVLPGDIGSDSRNVVYEPIPTDPDKFKKLQFPYDATDVSYDIHLIYNTTEQYRILHELLALAIGPRRYIQTYDDPTQVFFMQQFNYFDFPDSMDNIEEKVYSYEVKDIFLFENITDSNLSIIKELKVDIGIPDPISLLSFGNTSLVGLQTEEEIIVDFSSARFTNLS